jgi:hypothetical protein
MIAMCVQPVVGQRYEVELACAELDLYSLVQYDVVALTDTVDVVDEFGKNMSFDMARWEAMHPIAVENIAVS